MFLKYADLLYILKLVNALYIDFLILTYQRIHKNYYPATIEIDLKREIDSVFFFLIITCVQLQVNVTWEWRPWFVAVHSVSTLYTRYFFFCCCSGGYDVVKSKVIMHQDLLNWYLLMPKNLKFCNIRCQVSTVIEKISAETSIFPINLIK